MGRDRPTLRCGGLQTVIVGKIEARASRSIVLAASPGSLLRCRRASQNHLVNEEPLLWGRAVLALGCTQRGLHIFKAAPRGFVECCLPPTVYCLHLGLGGQEQQHHLQVALGRRNVKCGSPVVPSRVDLTTLLQQLLHALHVTLRGSEVQRGRLADPSGHGGWQGGYRLFRAAGSAATLSDQLLAHRRCKVAGFAANARSGHGSDWRDTSSKDA
mmetsp:Transcript_116672/g.325124  ORF Transcript_116672/g.325124 Transcript_116672/m.325124 type:complete len:214 (-) Transcript_116672:2-643(-)